MRKLLIPLTCAFALAFSATNASALSLSIGDAYYLGSINDGIPSNPTDEVGYINNLITLAAGGGDQTIGTETYNRVGSTLAGPFPTAVTTDSSKDESGNNTGIDGTGYTYILGKYDAAEAGSLVWVISGAAGVNDIDIPATFNERGLSHVSLYNFSDDEGDVPDGGATLGLLGLAMLGVGYLRRRLS